MTDLRKDIFDNPSAMLRWLDAPEGIIFLYHIEGLLESSRARLEKETERAEIYRRQGRIAALKDISNLHEELHKAIKDQATMRGVK